MGRSRSFMAAVQEDGGYTGGGWLVCECLEKDFMAVLYHSSKMKLGRVGIRNLNHSKILS